jgi:hypothetical protein
MGCTVFAVSRTYVDVSVEPNPSAALSRECLSVYSFKVSHPFLGSLASFG